MAISALPVRGTRDYLPNEVQLRDYIQTTILNTYKKYGFQRINTPIMEDIERLNKSDGGENLSLIFKLLKRGQKLDLTKENLNENDLVDSGLRYDLTMPLSRYFANNRQNLVLPFKCIQVDKVFRAERPQKGRLREFYQCDIDIIGDANINAEMELIFVTSQALQNIGFEDFTIRINDRRILSDIIKYAGFAEEEIPAVCVIFDKLDKIGLDGVKAELEEKEYPQNVVEKFMELLSGDALSSIDAVEQYVTDKEVVANVKKVLETISTIANGKFNIVYDKSLVRGMGYYTGMVFEISSNKFSSSIAGGGRYDKMIGKFLGESVPAVGFSIGFERVCEILKDENLQTAPEQKVILIYSDNDDFSEVLKKFGEMQSQYTAVRLLKRSKKLGKQIDGLIDNGFNYSFTFGESSELKPLSK